VLTGLLDEDDVEIVKAWEDETPEVDEFHRGWHRRP
jgi:hypothetical protein